MKIIYAYSSCGCSYTLTTTNEILDGATSNIFTKIYGITNGKDKKLIYIIPKQFIDNHEKFYQMITIYALQAKYNKCYLISEYYIQFTYAYIMVVRDFGKDYVLARLKEHINFAKANSDKMKYALKLAYHMIKVGYSDLEYQYYYDEKIDLKISEEEKEGIISYYKSINRYLYPKDCGLNIKFADYYKKDGILKQRFHMWRFNRILKKYSKKMDTNIIYKQMNEIIECLMAINNIWDFYIK